MAAGMPAAAGRLVDDLGGKSFSAAAQILIPYIASPSVMRAIIPQQFQLEQTTGRFQKFVRLRKFGIRKNMGADKSVVLVRAHSAVSDRLQRHRAAKPEP